METYYFTGSVPGTLHRSSHFVPFLFVAKLGRGTGWGWGNMSLLQSPLSIAGMGQRWDSNPGLPPKCVNDKVEGGCAPGGMLLLT